MSYKANVIDTAYCYDGSFQGFLCCIFESYAKREIPAEVLPPEQGQLTLFGVRDIPTDPQRACRVAAGLRRLGGLVQEYITTAFLSDQVGKDLVLLRFARLCFEKGSAAAQMLGDTDVAAAHAIWRAVHNEAHQFIEFVRFEQRGDLLGAVIHPKNKVLPLLRAHFCSRLPDEDFLIFDATHGAAMLRQNGQVQYLAMERYDPQTDADEQDWQALWKRFFDALTIEQRRNERCQMSHVQKRFWRDMCEMWPQTRPSEG